MSRIHAMKTAADAISMTYSQCAHVGSSFSTACFLPPFLLVAVLRQRFTEARPRDAVLRPEEEGLPAADGRLEDPPFFTLAVAADLFTRVRASESWSAGHIPLTDRSTG